MLYIETQKAKNGELSVVEVIELINKIIDEDTQKSKLLYQQTEKSEEKISSITEIISKAEEQNKNREWYFRTVKPHYVLYGRLEHRYTKQCLNMRKSAKRKYGNVQERL